MVLVSKARGRAMSRIIVNPDIVYLPDKVQADVRRHVSQHLFRLWMAPFAGTKEASPSLKRRSSRRECSETIAAINAWHM